MIMMVKPIALFGAVVLLLVNFSGCNQTINAVDVKVTNNGESELIITNLTIDGNELELFNVSANSTYTINLDPEEHPQGQSHKLIFTYKFEGIMSIINEESRSFEYYCYVTVNETESTIKLL